MTSARADRPGVPTGLAGTASSTLRDMLLAREISVPEIVGDAIASIERLDDGINAFLDACPDRALAEAEQAQKRLEAGAELPLLFGLPVAVKDAEAVAGLHFTAGSLIYRDRMAAADSLHVARLRAAGAIIIGKTNTPEFTLLGETRNRLGPDTRNPWDLSRTPGGSSGGSAAAVAAGMVPLSTGSDTAGSITVPAAFCGLAALKPSHRRIPIWPEGDDWQPYSDVGPIARDVAGLARMLAAREGPDPRDPLSQKAKAKSVGQAVTRELRIAWAGSIADLPVDPACAAVAADLARIFADLGHRIVEAGPDIANPGQIHDLLGAHEEFKVRGGLLAARPDLLNEETRAILAQGRDIDADRLRAARAASAGIADRFRRFMAGVDLFILPATACPAFALRKPPSEIGGRKVVADWPSYAPFNMLGNISGLPVATLPMRLSVDGLPLGALVFARLGQDGLLLSALAEAERLRGAFPEPPFTRVR
jgi:Asp-tRNA(Asn)/Glu-tRNA(Gln) amidotransferase A subunit family amidase